jgi:3-oxoacyl-[acyl-carrier protein] reductase
MQHICTVTVFPSKFYQLIFFLTKKSISGKVAIVTGSSRSIGAAVAKCLGEHGANVVVNYINNGKAADEVVRSIRSQGKGGAIAVKADASTMEGGRLLLQEAIKTFGKVDILVLNAAIAGGRTLAEIDEAFFDAHFTANVKAPLFMAKMAVPLLPSRTFCVLYFGKKN